MSLPAFASLLTLVLGAAAAPAQRDGISAGVDCFSAKPVAMFESWNTECNADYVGSGRVLHNDIAVPAWDKLCRPLAEDTHGINITMLADGCYIQAFRGHVCDDYPNNRLYKMKPGCLWTGGEIYRSFMVTCDNKTLEQLLGDD
ncbi:hypothetical protein GQ53DRAFT_825333 [Thozetella sp. PMI_491]|nr:hypothetical protein GQ53DRAFT_825333 [Thozetella sp. PMI_491]